jgi:hypothetical protein
VTALGEETQPGTTGSGDPHREKVRRNVARMEAGGASAKEIETYIQSEGIVPVAAQPEEGLGRRVLDRVGGALEQIVTHPIETAKGIVTAPIKSLADAVLSPGVGEARHSAALSKGGNSSGRPIDTTPYDAEHGAVTGKERAAAAAQTLATIAAPAIAGRVASGARALSLPAALARPAGVAAAGGTAGAAYSPDDPLAGGVAGAILAPALGESIRLAGKAGGKALSALHARPSGRTAAEMAADRAVLSAPVGEQSGANTRVMATAMGNEPPGPRPRAVTPTRGERVRAAVGKGVERAGVESSRTIALRLLGERLANDNVAPADAVAFAERNAGKPVAVLDLGGGNVSGLARTAKDVPGVGRRIIPEFLGRRSGGAGGTEGATLNRLVADVEQRIGLKPEDYYRSIDDMTTEMKGRAAKDYGAIRNTVIDDPEVLGLFNEPEWRAIHERIAANARVGGGEKIEPLAAVRDLGNGEFSNVQFPQKLGTLDLMKRQLDKVIAGKAEAVGPVDRDLAFNMRKRLNTILDRMDELHPEYGQARAAYRGSAEAIDAYELGKQEFMGLDPRAITRKLSQMPERLRDLYRRGGYDALRTWLSKKEDGGNLGAQLEKNPDIRDRVAALAKTPEEAAALAGDIHTERAMGDRKAAILGGPNTAERIIEHQATVPKVTRAGNAVRNVPWLGKPLGWAVDNRLTRGEIDQTSATMGEAAKFLTMAGPEDMRAFMSELARLRAADEARALHGGARRGRAVGTAVGTTHREQR